MGSIGGIAKVWCYISAQALQCTQVALQTLGGKRGMLTKSSSTFGNELTLHKKDREELIPKVNPRNTISPNWILLRYFCGNSPIKRHFWNEVRWHWTNMNRSTYPTLHLWKRSSTFLYMHLAEGHCSWLSRLPTSQPALYFPNTNKPLTSLSIPLGITTLGSIAPFYTQNRGIRGTYLWELYWIKHQKNNTIESKTNIPVYNP